MSVPLCIIFLSAFVYTLAIDCFKCVSFNHDYPACDDPFHNNYTLDVFESPCMGGRKGRDGLFPATSCVKITGIFGKICSIFSRNVDDCLLWNF